MEPPLKLFTNIHIVHLFKDTLEALEPSEIILVMLLDLHLFGKRFLRPLWTALEPPLKLFTYYYWSNLFGKVS